VLDELKTRLSEIAYLDTLVEDVDEALGGLMARVVGIDLGTTNSLVAVMEDGVAALSPESGDRRSAAAVRR
jgi:molecular chaperone DnaK (HSP70)